MIYLRRGYKQIHNEKVASYKQFEYITALI
jgi:hypothetical protein